MSWPPASRFPPPRDSKFTFVLIKPTHYDDDGYPIQWFRSALPSNTLACMNSLAEDARRREVLGPGVSLEIDTYDETNRRVVPSRIIRDLKRRGGRALIGIVGVQSNQFPRSVDLARQFRAAGLQVCIGGFHVSGCIAMLPEMPSETAGRAGDRHFAVRRRIGGAPARRGAARRLERPAEAALQFHGPVALARGRAGADPAAQARPAHLRHLFQHRSRPRLPVSVLVLHHHQRAGPQEPLPHARRSRKDHPRQQGAGHRPVLHHRRQFRPQHRLGDPARPRHRAQGARRASIAASRSRSTRSATRFRISSRRRPRPACGACSSVSRTSIRTI